MKNLKVLFTIFILFLFIITPVYGKEKPKKLKPDGIVIHSYDCKGPLGKYAAKKFGNPLKNYHYIVKINGDIIAGQPEDKIIPHIGSKFLSRSLSVMVEGNFRQNPFINNLDKNHSLPAKQFKSLKNLLYMLMKKYNIPLSQIERHVDHDEGRYCPGYNFPYFQVLYSMAKEILKKHGRETLEEICKRKNISIPIKNARLVVNKSRYTLDLYSGKILLRTYPIAMSNKPKGDKIKEWDRKTPLGKFYICEKYPMRAWMEISYPTKRHAKIALSRKKINKNTHDNITTSQDLRCIPPHKTGMGHDVGLHAGGFDYGKLRKDCTAGCIGLEDPEAYEIYYAVPLGTEVIIKK